MSANHLDTCPILHRGSLFWRSEVLQADSPPPPSERVTKREPEAVKFVSPMVSLFKLLSWNVNGIRAISKKGFSESIESIAPDIMCLQEVRATEADIDLAQTLPSLASKYMSRAWNPALRKGYSGTMVLAGSKTRIYAVQPGLDAMSCVEGRVQTLDLGFATLINVYTPNVGRELARLQYRMDWDKAFIQHVKQAQKEKPVIVVGDLNCAHREIDLARPKQNQGSAGFTKEERAGFTSLLETGLVDTFRHQHGDILGRYTWWSNIGGARAKNIGWRIDYILIDKVLVPRLQKAEIHDKILGSDHCPVSITLALD